MVLQLRRGVNFSIFFFILISVLFSLSPANFYYHQNRGDLEKKSSDCVVKSSSLDLTNYRGGHKNLPVFENL